MLDRISNRRRDLCGNGQMMFIVKEYRLDQSLGETALVERIETFDKIGDIFWLKQHGYLSVMPHVSNEYWLVYAGSRVVAVIFEEK